MSVLLSRKNKTSKPNWMRMLKANDLLWKEYKHDAKLKAGKGWLIQSIDATRIAEFLIKNNIAFEKKSEYEIEIL